MTNAPQRWRNIRRPPRPPCPAIPMPRQEQDGRLPVVSRNLLKLIRQPPTLSMSCLSVPLPHGHALRVVLHTASLHVPLGNMTFEATIPSPATSILKRIAIVDAGQSLGISIFPLIRQLPIAPPSRQPLHWLHASLPRPMAVVHAKTGTSHPCPPAGPFSSGRKRRRGCYE